MPFLVGVTSHRNILPAEHDGVRDRVCEFLARLRTLVPDLPITVISALAEGGDQLVAEAALASGCRLIAVLPMMREDYLRDFSDTAARVSFQRLLAAADVVEMPMLSDQQDYTAKNPSSPARDRQYAEAGMYISEHCHVLLAIWDGKESALLGGTAQIVAYHLHGIRPTTTDRRRGHRGNGVLGSDLERLAYQIVCSRDTFDGAPPSSLRPMQTLWHAGSVVTPGEDCMPAGFLQTCAHMNEFVADARRYHDRINAKADLRSRTGLLLAAGQASDLLFQAADFLALHFQRRVLFAMRSIYSIAALMGIAFMCYSDLPAQDYMIFVFLALFASGISLSLVAKRRGWHRKYLDYRALAEGLRVQSYWRRAGLSVTADSEFAHDNFLQKQDVELGWIRNVMRWAGLEADLAPASREADALQRVIAEWVGEADGAGQLGYYTRRSVQRARLHRITETLGALSLWTGISISVFLAVFFLRLSQDTKTTLIVIMAVVSILAAVREAYAYRKADKELIKQYRYMCRIFSSARRALDRARDEDEQREILRALGEASLAEHAEWTLMHRERPLEHAKW
jgi:hypothetical protein